MNPWTSIWFTPQKTAAWARDSRPLYGVVLLLILHVVITLVGFAIEAPESSSASQSSAAMDGKQKFGLYLDIWLMPVVLLFLLNWISKRLKGTASFNNTLWVVVWSQLPVMLLTLVSMPMEMAGMKISEPLLSNKLTTVGAQLVIDPPIPQFNLDGVIYFFISTVFLLWSLQILMSGIAAVNGVTVKRALWFLTLAMIALMLVRLPITIILGDRDLLDILGLKGIMEL